MEKPCFALFSIYALCLVVVKGENYADLSKEILNDMSRECVKSISKWTSKIIIPNSNVHIEPIISDHQISSDMKNPTRQEFEDYTHEQANEHMYSIDEDTYYDHEEESNEGFPQYTQETHPVNNGFQRIPMPKYPNNPGLSQKINFPQMPSNPFQDKVLLQPDFEEAVIRHNVRGQYNDYNDASHQEPVKDTPRGSKKVQFIPPRSSNTIPAGWPVQETSHSKQTTGPMQSDGGPNQNHQQPQNENNTPWKEDNPNDMMAAFKISGKESREIAWGAMVSEEVTKRIVKRYHLNKEQIAKELPFFDISGTEIINNCVTPPEENFESLDQVAKARLPVPKCALKRYRYQNGFCNNILFQRKGNAFIKFNRGLPPDYSDGISSPRVGKSGRPLPSGRLVSNYIVRDGNRPDRQITHLVMQWGQFIDHDISHTTEWKDINNNTLDCCEPKNQKHPQCFPIPIPNDDPFYSHFGNTCMPITRSLPAPRPGCTLGSREQLNGITAFIDASNVYGSTVEIADSLRQFVGGRLRVMTLNGKGKEILPNKGGDPSKCPYMKMFKPGDQCSFEAGDTRLNLKVSLTTLHIIWLREHNRIAGIFERVNPQWDDEIIYQETRKLVGAMMQQIIYAEYLPWLLGETWNHWDIELLSEGYYDGYDVFTDPAVYNEFAAAAYRYGHSLVNAKLDRYNFNNEKIPANDTWVSDHIFKPFDLYNPGRIDEYLRGLLIENAQTFDNLITSQLTNWLFKPNENSPGLDLAAINIQRGRDHGLPGYNYWRSLCGLKPARTFKELEKMFIPGQAEQFSQIYEHPDDIDLFPAGISEIPVKDGIIGPVFACIIGKQFEVLRKGDRFWYENYIPQESGLTHGFTSAQLNEIRKVKLSKVICENADAIQIVQVNALLKAHPQRNPIVKCEKLPSMDLHKWKNADRNNAQLGKMSSLADLIAIISPSSRSTHPTQLNYAQ